MRNYNTVEFDNGQNIDVVVSGFHRITHDGSDDQWVNLHIRGDGDWAKPSPVRSGQFAMLNLSVERAEQLIKALMGAIVESEVARRLTEQADEAA
jgi:hypothetical protein